MLNDSHNVNKYTTYFKCMKEINAHLNAYD